MHFQNCPLMFPYQQPPCPCQQEGAQFNKHQNLKPTNTRPEEHLKVGKLSLSLPFVLP